MEPAKINWQTLESVFIHDATFENINAPQWVDFTSPLHPSNSLDDDAWFCKPDCKHPKTAEDFLKSTPTSKILRSVAVSKLIGLGDWSRIREGNLKRRVALPQDDGENQNPNLETPIAAKPAAAKDLIKSSAEKLRQSDKEEEDYFSEIPLDSDEAPKLKSVVSGRDLFAGRDLLGKITEFCGELKKMAIARAKEKERDDDCGNVEKVDDKRKECGVSGDLDRCLAKTDDKEIRERKPFVELSKERSPLKEKPRKKITRGDGDAENIPLSLDLKLTKQAAIRTSPPTPQCFSGAREPFKSTPSKAPKSKLKERGPFQEIQLKHVLKEEELGEKSNGRRSPLPPVSANREGSRTLDVFWFFKPCAHSSTEF